MNEIYISEFSYLQWYETVDQRYLVAQLKVSNKLEHVVTVYPLRIRILDSEEPCPLILTVTSLL